MLFELLRTSACNLNCRLPPRFAPPLYASSRKEVLSSSRAYYGDLPACPGVLFCRVSVPSLETFGQIPRTLSPNALTALACFARPVRIGFLHYLHNLHCFLIVQGGCLSVKTHLLRCGGVYLSVCQGAFSRFYKDVFFGETRAFSLPFARFARIAVFFDSAYCRVSCKSVY